MTSVGPISEGTAGTIYNVFFRQYVSDPLAAQTIAGTVTGWIKAAESNLAANANGQLVIRVVSNDGSIVRGTLLAATTTTGTAPANEFTATLGSRLFPGSGGTLSSVAVQDGDRIVIDIGTRNHNTVTTNYTTTLQFGDNSATDHTAAAQTTTVNPWLEFSQDLLYPPDISGVYATAVAGTTGLVGYWRLGESSGTVVNDNSGNGRFGANYGATVGAAGLLTDDTDTAYSFDGVGNRVIIGNPSGLQLSTGTIEAWVNASTQSNYRSIIQKADAYDLAVNNNVLVFWDPGTSSARSTGVSLNDGVRHHIALSFQSGVANGSIVYIDGVAVLTATLTQTTQANSLAIGNHGTVGQPFLGIIDEVAVYSAVLSDATIADHYAKGSTANLAHPLTGSVASASTLAVTRLSLAQPLTGSAASSSTATVTRLALAQPLAGSVASSSAASATRLTLNNPLTGSVTSTSSASAGAITVGHPLTGSTASTSAVASGSLTVTHVLTGAIVSTSAATGGTITVGHPLLGTVTGASVLTGEMAGAGPATHVLTGEAAASSTAAATGIVVSYPLTGATTGTSTVAATRLALTQPLAGSVASASAVAVTRITLAQPLAGASSASTFLSAPSIALAYPLAGAVAGTSTAAAPRIVASHPFSGQVWSASAVTGDQLRMPHPLDSAVSAVSAMAGQLGILQAFGNASRVQRGPTVTANRVALPGVVMADRATSLVPVTAGRTILPAPVTADRAQSLIPVIASRTQENLS
jgi:hypothetical protein